MTAAPQRPEVQAVARTVQRLRRRRRLRKVLVVFAVPVVIAAILLTTVFRPVMITNRAMLPTLSPGQIAFVNALDRTPQRKDVAQLTPAQPDGSPLFRRILALPGDTVALAEDGSLTVNGSPAAAPATATCDMPASLAVPEGYLFVLCDNPAEGLDSRSSQMGLIPTAHVMGIVW